jgi:tetratricopeptide (TPR) repeat protein
VVSRVLLWSSALLLAAGLVVSQILLGGWWYPVLAAPGYLLVGVAAVLAGLLFWKSETAPGAWCTGTALALGAYCFWRQTGSADAYMAREDAWLLLGALCVYFTVAWQLRATGPRWIVLGVLFAALMGQVFLAVAQFTTTTPFHPLAELAVQLRLPDGKEEVPHGGLVTGTLHARTALSGVLEVTTFLALGMLVWGRAAVWVKLLLLWVCAAGFVGMMICLSRSAYLALPAGLAVFSLASFFIIQRGIYRYRLLFGSAALSLVLLSLGLAVATGWESIAVWLRMGELAVDQYREALWSMTVPPMLQLDPWFGTGANTFEDLARRYRGGGFTADPIHAHNDWLQLLIEYGWIGFVLGAAFFFIHFFAGFRNVMRLAAQTPNEGIFPQGMSLGLAAGSLSAFAAIGSHAVFDYSLHLPAVAMLAALSAGWLAAARAEDCHAPPAPAWLRPLAALPVVTGLVLIGWVWRDAPAEYAVLQAENALIPLDVEKMEDRCAAGLAADPGHPRLLWLNGLALRTNAERLLNSDLRRAAQRLGESSDHFNRAAAARPNDVFAQVELARTLDLEAYAKFALAEATTNPFSARGLRFEAGSAVNRALPAHLRAIARDPDHARGYEGLARHYLLQGRLAEAERISRIATKLTGTREGHRSLKQIGEMRKAGQAP